MIIGCSLAWLQAEQLDRLLPCINCAVAAALSPLGKTNPGTELKTRRDLTSIPECAPRNNIHI